MQFGLNLGNGGPSADPRTMADLAELAEQSGWDGVFLEDYIVYQNKTGTPTYDPWICLAAMAMHTQRIRLGTTVTPLPRRRVAAMLDEGLNVLVGLWSGEPFTYQGRFYQADDVMLVPRPVQTPRIPIWIGGQYPKPGPIRRAARWDGSCMFISTSYSATGITQRDWTSDDVRAFLAMVAEVRPDGAEHYDMAVGGRARKADWEAERALIEAVGSAGATWWIEWVKPADRRTMEAAIAGGPLSI